MSYTWAWAINSSKSSSGTPQYNKYWKHCHTNNQELSSNRGFEPLLVCGALPVTGGGFGCHLIIGSSPVILLSSVLFYSLVRMVKLSQNRARLLCVHFAWIFCYLGIHSFPVLVHLYPHSKKTPFFFFMSNLKYKRELFFMDFWNYQILVKLLILEADKRDGKSHFLFHGITLFLRQLTAQEA